MRHVVEKEVGPLCVLALVASLASKTRKGPKYDFNVKNLDHTSRASLTMSETSRQKRREEKPKKLLCTMYPILNRFLTGD